MASNPLIGTWRLVSWVHESPDGDITYPFGPDATGSITYTHQGYMSVTIMRAGREPFSSPDLLAGSPEEKIAAAESYIGYCGTYELGEGSVVHRVTHSFFPNWVGTEQERFMHLEGARLTLSTAPRLFGGKLRVARLTWERIDAGTED